MKRHRYLLSVVLLLTSPLCSAPAQEATHGTHIQVNVDIMSDTKGVDLGPYMRVVIPDIRDLWSASAQKTYQQAASGKEQPVAANSAENGPVYSESPSTPIISFTVMPDGKVSEIRLEHTTKNVALDRDAWAAITSTQFPPLPANLHAPLKLRASFLH